MCFLLLLSFKSSLARLRPQPQPAASARPLLHRSVKRFQAEMGGVMVGGSGAEQQPQIANAKIGNQVKTWRQHLVNGPFKRSALWPQMTSSEAHSKPGPGGPLLCTDTGGDLALCLKAQHFEVERPASAPCHPGNFHFRDRTFVTEKKVQ